jgi:hypothetical protein
MQYAQKIRVNFQDQLGEHMQIHEVTHRQDEGFITDFGKAVGTGLLKDVEKYAFGSDVAATLRGPSKQALQPSVKPPEPPKTIEPPKPLEPPKVYQIGGQVLNPAVPADAKIIAQIQAQEAGKTQ